MRLRVKILTILLFCACGIFGQNMPTISLFDQNLSYFNPAATGNREVLTASLFYRIHWTGMEGAPLTGFGNIHAPLKNPKIALGLILEHESIGSTNYTSVYFNYAYRFYVGSGRLALGLRIGLVNGSQKNVSLRNDDDQAFNENNSTFFVPNAGFGAYYYTDFYWASFSIPKFFGFESDASGKYKLSHDVSKYEYHFAGGGKIALPSEFSFEPSVLMVYSPANPFTFTMNAIGMYKNSYRAGLGYRLDDALIILIGLNFRQFSIGYSYDINIGNTTDYSSGSHEINLQYRFGYKVEASNPREF